MAKKPQGIEEEELAEGEGEEPTAESQEEGAEAEEVITDPGAAPAEVAEGEVKAEGEAEGEKPAATAEAEAAPEAEGVPEAEAEAVLPELPPRLMHAAHRAGLTDDQVAALGDNAEGVLSRLADSYDAVSRDFGSRGKPTFTAEELETVKRTGAPPAAKDELGADLLVELDPDVYGAEMVGTMKEKFLPRLNALTAEVRQLRQAEYNRRAAQLTQEANEFFESVKADYGELFGEGPIGKLEPGTPQHDARLRVYKEADIIANGAVATGRPMTVREALDRAVSIVTRDQALETARGQIARDVQKRARQVTQKPTHRAATRSWRKPEEKAADAYAQKIRDMGLSTAEED